MNAPAKDLQALMAAIAQILGRAPTEHDAAFVTAAASLSIARELAELNQTLRSELGGIFDAVAPIAERLNGLTAAAENISDAIARAGESLETNF